MSSVASPTVVLLNGPAGVGKTTIGRELAASARNGVCIHGDDLKSFIVARDLDSVRTGLTYVGCAALADVFIDAGYDLVVVDFIFSCRRDVRRLVDALTSSPRVLLFTLWAPLATVIAREATRVGRPPLGDRVTGCWNELSTNRDELGTVIDALAAPDEIVRLLIARAETTEAEVPRED